MKKESPMMWILCACLLNLGGAAFAAGETSQNAPKAGSVISWDSLGQEIAKKYQGDGMGIQSSPAGATLSCVLQKLEGQIRADGLWLRSTLASDLGNVPFRLQAMGMGRARISNLSAQGRVEVSQDLARFVRPGLVEEYSVSADGVRQDFLVLDRPPGSGPLSLVLQVDGAKATHGISGVHLDLDGSGRRIAYSRLCVTDARGRQLSATISVVTKDELAVTVEDADAVYPVRIDPTFSDADWVSMGSLAYLGNLQAVAVDSEGKLYVGGGGLSLQGAPSTLGILCWNGTEWSTLGTAFMPGMNPDVDGEVKVMKLHGKYLYVGGMFAMAGGQMANRVARWDTEARMWTTLGFGFQAGVNGEVRAIEIIGTDVFVAGLFTSAGGQPANQIARWSSLTMTWTAVDTGIFGMVDCLVAVGGELYVGGSFSEFGGVPVNNIAKWSPTSSQWSALGEGVNGSVSALTASGTQLIAAGSFTSAGNVSAKGIASWNGTSWSALAAGVNGQVASMVAAGPDLYVGGQFVTSGGTERQQIALVGADGVLNEGFNPGLQGHVRCSARQADGKLLVGGYLSRISGVTRSHIARLNADRTLDMDFNPTLNGEVRGVAVQSDGKILIVGGFNSVAGVTRQWIARLNQDGTLDSGFNPNITGDFGAGLNAVALQSDGKVAIAGRFSHVGGAARSHLARLNADGSLDTAFAPVVSGEVDAIQIQADGKWVIDGSYSSIGGVFRGLARLNVNGTLDSSFNPSTAGPKRVLTLQADGKVLVGGALIAYGNDTSRKKLARFNANGTLDTSFQEAGINGTVDEVTVQSDGKILIGGDFTSVAGEPRSRLARLNADGTLDTSFAPIVSGSVSKIIVVAGESVLFAGGFTAVGGTLLNHLARWDGSAWNAVGRGSNYAVGKLALSGEVLCAVGGFTEMNGVKNVGISRLHIPSGRWTSPGVGLDYLVFALAVSGPDLYVGGDFLTAGGEWVNHIAHWDGSTWSALGGGINGTVYALAISGTDLIAGGSFTTAGSVPAANIARWSLTGKAWSSFGAGLSSSVNAVAVNGSTIYAGGSFIGGVSRWNAGLGTWSTLGSGVNGNVKAIALRGADVYAGGTFDRAEDQPSFGLAAMRADGSLNSTFNLNTLGFLGPCQCAAVQADGRILVASAPTPFNPTGLTRHFADGLFDLTFLVNTTGVTIQTISSMAVQSDGKIILAGRFNLEGQPQAFHVLRLTPEFPFLDRFSIDASFSPASIGDPGPGGITGVVVQADGKILVSGGPMNLTRFNADGTADTGFMPTVMGQVSAMALQPDGKILLATNLMPNVLTRLNSDGTTDVPPFLNWTGVNPMSITGIVVEADGKIVLSGGFMLTSLGALTQKFVRFDVGGMIDRSFSPPGTSFTMQDVADLAPLPGGGYVFAGSFTNIYAQTHGIAKWNGSSWSSLGYSLFSSGPMTQINALAAQGSDLYVGGQFNLDQGAPLMTTNVARWDGSSWHPVGTGLNSTVNALAISGGELYAGTMMGGLNAGVYKFDGTWNSLGSGVDMTVQALAAGSGSLFVGGWFNMAGGKSSQYLARAKLPTSPEIAIRGNNTLIADGDTTPDVSDHTDFGHVAVSGASLTRTFTVENGGLDVLYLSGSPRVALSGGQAADFTVSLLPAASLAPSTHTTFQITFDPSSSGPRSATLTVISNDTDESPYQFLISGIGALPEIVVEQPATVSLVDGSAVIDFGGLTVGTGVTRVFVIKNVGLAPLTGIGIGLAGPQSSRFAVTANPSLTVAPGGSTTFHLQFVPSFLGGHAASLQISSNDADEQPFDISLVGDGLTASQGWAQTFFGTTSTTEGAAAPTSDPNNNGIPNLVEYALGGDPVGGTTGTEILPVPALNPEMECMEFQLTRYLDRDDITLTVQVADSLAGPWLDLARSANGAPFEPLAVGATVHESGSGPTRWVRVCDIYPVDDPLHPKRFMKLQVSQ